MKSVPYVVVQGYLGTWEPGSLETLDGLSKNSEEKYCDVFTRLGANLATFLSLKVPWSTRLQRSPEVGKYFFVRFYSYCKNASKQIHLSAKIQERFFLRCKNAKKNDF